MNISPLRATFGPPSPSLIKFIAGSTFFITTAILAFAQQASTQPAMRAENTSGKAPTPADVTVNKDATSSMASGDAIELSPFQVFAENDNGYAARDTLMGTRLRTDLKDIASSISVVTKDFMEDINANDLEGLLTYTTGTEVGGVGGNFSAAADSGQRTVDIDAGNNGSTVATRIRGLGSADTTRDYFLSAIPVDGYNIERVEISRGPNALLYGLGAPAGIINSNLKRADTRRTRTNVGIQFGSYGTRRATLDHNQVLIKDKLALRFDSLYKDTRYRIEDTFSRDKRAYLAATYAPFRSTVFKANIELGEQKINQPRNAPPYDTYSYWWRMGQPAYDPTTNTTTLLGVRDPTLPSTVNINMTQFGDVQFRNMMVFPDPDSSEPGIAVTGNPTIMTSRATRSRVNPAGGVPQEAALATLTGGVNFVRAQIPSSDPGRSFYRWSTIQDPSIFDFYHYQLDGPNNLKTNQWNAFNASVEQRFFKDSLGVEAAFTRENLDTTNFRNSTSQEYNILIDINTKLLNGESNPNFGRPLMAATGSQTQTDANREAKRLTAYYDLDLRKVPGPSWFGKILGRHTFTGAYTDQDSFRFDRRGYPAAMSPDYQLYHYLIEQGGLVNNIASASRAVARVSYLGPSLVNFSGPMAVPIQPVTASRLPEHGESVRWLTTQVPATTATAPNPWVVKDFTLISVDGEEVDPAVIASGATRALENVKSQVFILNDRWFEGNIVTTFGWRRDEWDFQSTSGNPPVDPATGLALLSDETFPMLPTTSGAREDHSSYGIVAHTPEFIRRRLPLGADLSLYASKANNFQVSSQRYDIHGDPIDPPSGVTKEYGVRLALLDRKFELRATHYETGATLARDTSTSSTTGQINDRVEGIIEAMYTPGGFFEQRWGTNYAANGISESIHQNYLSAKNALDTWMQTPGAQDWFKTFRYNITTLTDGSKLVDGRDNRSDVVNTTDFISKGWEFEAVFNPTRSWQLALNGAQQTSVTFNSSRESYEVLYDVFDPLFSGPFANISRVVSPSDDPDAITFYQDAVGTAYIGPNRAKAMENTIAPEVRAWRWNAVTRYTFLGGWFKGLTVGGSVRWEDKVAIGYPYIRTAETGTTPVLDVQHPYYGPKQTTFDAFLRYSRELGDRVKWTIQLNIKNIGVGNEIIPTYANPDGSYASFRIREPQSWAISNSFDF